MAQSISLTSKIKIKTNSILHNSLALLQDKKTSKLFAAHSKGIHIYDCGNQSFQDVKIPGNTSGQISCLTRSDDLIFFCAGMRILACGVNGKILFDCDTYLATDKIDAIYLYGYQLWLVSSNMVSQFLIGGSQLSNKQSRNTQAPPQSIQDTNSQHYDVKINHSLLIKIDAEKPFVLLLKNNNQLQIYDGKENKTSFSTNSPPTYGYIYPNVPNNNKVLIGTMSGQLMYVLVDRKGIKVIWSLKQNSSGRINCIVEVKNGFMVFRDQCLQMWNDDKELIGRTPTSEKILSSIYLPQQESVFYGTYTGNLVEMFNYEKMMKLAKEKNEINDKNNLLEEIRKLEKIKADLKAEADRLRPQTMANTPNITQNNINLYLDYDKLCYKLSIVSDRQIEKLMIKGQIRLSDGIQGLQFQGKQNEQSVYMLKFQGKNNLIINFNYVQEFKKNQKLLLTIYNGVEGKLIASKYFLDLKHLYLHQKIQSNLIDKQSFKANSLVVTGQFKYHVMNGWLNSIFTDFSSQSLQKEYISFCYESLLTKNKIYISYKDNYCQFYSQSPTPLIVIKKSILHKAYERNLSLNYNTNFSLQGIKNLLFKIAPRIRELQKIKKQYELVPGLKQLQGQKMSADMKQILMRSEDINRSYSERKREYEQMENQMAELVIASGQLSGRQISYGKEQLKGIIDMKTENVIKLIE